MRIESQITYVDARLRRLGKRQDRVPTRGSEWNFIKDEILVLGAIRKTLTSYKKMSEWGNAVLSNPEAAQFARQQQT